MNMSEFEEHRKKALEHQNRQGHSKVSINSDQSFFILLFELIIFGILLAALTSLIFPSTDKKQTNAAEAVTSKATDVTWTAAGDVVFHGPIMNSEAYYDPQTDTYDYTPIFDYCRPLLSDSDVSTVTLETSLAGEEAGYSGYPMFRAPDALADSLAGCGIDMVNLASNHLLDGGDEGLLRTMDVLTEKKLSYLGTQPEESQKNYDIVDVNGMKIGVISYVYETTEDNEETSINALPVSDEMAPLINSFDYNDLDTFYGEMEDALAGMKEDGAQYTIAYMHWGTEYQTQQSEEQEEIAGELCDLGVDALIGSHPHVIQPVDVLTSSDGEHQMLCAYAIGNFLSNQQIEYMQDELPTGETEDSYLLSLSLSSDDKGKVSLTDVTFTPMWTHRYAGENGATFVVLPVDNTEQLEEQTGITGIKEQADESAARTQAIIGDGVEKVKASLPLKSAL